MKSELVAEARNIEQELDFSRRYWLCVDLDTKTAYLAENYMDRPIEEAKVVTEQNHVISAELYSHLSNAGMNYLEFEKSGDPVNYMQVLVAGAELQQALKKLTDRGSKIDGLQRS